MAGTKKKMTFDDKINKLEKLMDEMETMSIDDMIKSYSEAIKLINECKETLDGYKADFKRITENGIVSDIKTTEENSDGEN